MPETFLKSAGKGPFRCTLLLAHGAGAPMDSPFMDALALALTERDVRVLRFEFPYMAGRRSGQGKRPPPPMAALETHFEERIESLPGPLFIGGKSMGGRVASLVADRAGVAGLLCFGYPFHPPGKPERTRVDHLGAIRTPTLILQGTRDPLGRPEEVAGYALGKQIRVAWLESGDHDFKPLKRSGSSQQELIERAAEAAAEFMRELAG